MNITNGVTPRRWLYICNRPLSGLITAKLGTSSWLTDLGRTRALVDMKHCPKFQAEWAKVKLENKRRLVQWVSNHCKIELDEDAMFDIQVKRIHEYKRQLLNALYCIHRYLEIKGMSEEDRKKNVVKRAILFGGKAAPGYLTAKNIIKLVNNIAAVVNKDPATSKYASLSTYFTFVL